MSMVGFHRSRKLRAARALADAKLDLEAGTVQVPAEVEPATVAPPKVVAAAPAPLPMPQHARHQQHRR